MIILLIVVVCEILSILCMIIGFIGLFFVKKESELMRSATKKERESVNRYIKSVSKPTGEDFYKTIQISSKNNKELNERNNMDRVKYLKITIHDNDFTVALRDVCDILYDIFYNECNYPTEDDFDDLKYLIKYLWYGIHETRKYYRWKDSYIENNIRKDSNFIDYFEPDLEIVSYLDVPEWENNECAYIPLFDGGKIIVI